MRPITKIVVVTMLVATFFGCEVKDALVKEKEKFDVDSDYKKVVYFNGVDQYEAETIAQMKLVKSVYASYFDTTKAKIRTDEAAQKYPDYWFIDFTQGILFDAPSYLVVIDKKTGDILLSDEYFPKKISNLDWVFERTKKQPAK